MTIQESKPASVVLNRESSGVAMRDVSIVEVNLSDIDHNMRVLRGIVGSECGLCPIVKADGYGLGAARIAKRLASNGAEIVAVYTPDQAADLFRAAIGCRVLVLMPLREVARVDELYRALIADRLQLTVHDMDHVSDLIAITERYGVTINVHLEVDTGMSRGGCGIAEAPAILKRIAGSKRLHLAGLFTHFASAESDVEFTNRQMATFDKLLVDQAQYIPNDCRIHVASSFAALRHKRYHKSMVRVGLAWAGYGMEWMHGDEIIPAARQLRPSVTWKSRIVQIKNIAPDTPVGYGSGWTSRRPSIVGLVPVGYADGYPIGLGARDDKPTGACVAVMTDDGDLQLTSGAAPLGYVPVIGAVNMDQITIDLTDVMDRARLEGRQIRVGTHVELISPDSAALNHLPTLARMAGTIPHEMLCRLNPRLKRLYAAPVAALGQPAPVDAMVG